MTQYCECLTVRQFNAHFIEQRCSKLIFSAYWVNRVEAHCREDVPGRHLSAVLVAAKAVGGVAVHLAHNLRYILLCLFGFTCLVEQIRHMMARLVSVGILANHSGAEDGQVGILGWGVGEHAVELLHEYLLAHMTDEAVNVVLNAPHIVPCIALADVRSILVGAEIGLEFSLAVAWLHECGGGVILVAPVACTAVELRGDAVMSHGLGHAGDAVVIIRIFQRARHCPVVGIIRVYNIVWDIPEALV